MRAVIKREIRNYLKNPVFWIGLLFILFELFQILNPYLQIHYFQSEQEVEALEPDTIADADITEGYVKSTEEERMNLTSDKIKKDMAEFLDITEEEAGDIVDGMRRENMDIYEMEEYLAENYDFVGKYGLKYYYEISEYHKGTKDEANDYIRKNMKTHTFSYYFARKFADFCGLYLGFFAAILLAFLFIRDTRKDTYELLHTKPVSAWAYVCGKVAGAFLTMLTAWGILVVLFGGLCEFYGMQRGLPVSILDFLSAAVIYILPNMLMITCIYTVTALLFKNPLPAVPAMFLYLVYSNMGSVGPDGVYGYYGRPLAIMVRFPGNFFETSPPPLAALNQTFLIIASVCLLVFGVCIWRRRRV